MAVLTISRQFGAGGITIGKRVAEKLGYTLYDSQLIQLIAEKAKVSPDWVETLEKEAGGRFHRFLAGVVPKSLVDRILDDRHGYIDEEIYVDLLFSIVREIADRGDVVIIGRGGQYILKDRPDACHVLLIANRQDRIQFIESKYRLSSKEATAAVDMEDKRRINLYRKFGKTDYDQPPLYNLVLNMSRTDIDTACEIILKAMYPLR